MTTSSEHIIAVNSCNLSEMKQTINQLLACNGNRELTWLPQHIRSNIKTRSEKTLKKRLRALHG